MTLDAQIARGVYPDPPSESDTPPRPAMTGAYWSARRSGLDHDSAVEYAARDLGVDPATLTRISGTRGGWRPGAGRRVGAGQPVLAGLTAREVAVAILDREPTASESRAIGYALAGTTDLGIVRLHALLEARPELDAREIVRELADRIVSRRER